MTRTETVTLDHADPRDPTEQCSGVELYVEVEWTPPEHGWGADADGNRGITLPGFWTMIEAPEHCPECGHVFDAGEIRCLEEIGAKRAAAAYDE